MTTQEQKTDGAALWLEIFIAFLIAKGVQLSIFPDAYLLILWPIAYLVVYFTIGKFLIRKFLTKKIW